MSDLSNIKVSASPHIKNEDNTRQIMIDVIIALMPALAVAIFVFGVRALTMTLVSVCGCIACEWAYEKIMKKPVTVPDMSAVVTGILIVYCIPVSAPMWLVLAGDAFAIIIVKQLYGGIGKNFMNPALASRAFLLACWPVFMTTWPAVRTALPFFTTPDVVSSATPMAFLKALDMAGLPSLTDLGLGMVAGSMGETSALAILAGGIYLIYRKVISVRIPLSFIGTVALLTFFFPRGQDAVTHMQAHLLSGGLALGAIFMATDYTTSPVTTKGQILYGIGCGALTVFIRYFGAYPEGVCYAILIMNCTVFLIEKITKSRPFGHNRKAKKAEISAETEDVT